MAQCRRQRWPPPPLLLPQVRPQELLLLLLGRRARCQMPPSCRPHPPLPLQAQPPLPPAAAAAAAAWAMQVRRQTPPTRPLRRAPQQGAQQQGCHWLLLLPAPAHQTDPTLLLLGRLPWQTLEKRGPAGRWAPPLRLLLLLCRWLPQLPWTGWKH